MFGDDIRQAKESYRQLGPSAFWGIVLGTIGYIGVGATLLFMAVWPGTCVHEGRRFAGLMRKYGCSPDLLSGGPIEYALFVFLWSMPVTIAGALIYAFVKKHRRDRNPIRPLDSVE